MFLLVGTGQYAGIHRQITGSSPGGTAVRAGLLFMRHSEDITSSAAPQHSYIIYLMAAYQKHTFESITSKSGAYPHWKTERFDCLPKRSVFIFGIVPNPYHQRFKHTKIILMAFLPYCISVLIYCLSRPNRERSQERPTLLIPQQERNVLGGHIIERHHSSNSRHPHYIGKCGQFKEYGNKSGISAKR